MPEMMKAAMTSGVAQDLRDGFIVVFGFFGRAEVITSYTLYDDIGQ
jgi:hypothetical protein